MPAPIFSLATTGTAPKVTTKQVLEAEINRVIGVTFDQANPEDRDAAALSAQKSADSATTSTAQAVISTTQAGVATTAAFQAILAAIAAGASLVTMLSDPVPANGSIELLQTGAGTQVHEVQAGAWVQLGWLGSPVFPTIAAMGEASGFVNQQYVDVEDTLNGEKVRFKYKAFSTLPADGVFIIDAEGMGDNPATRGRLISQRKVYSDWAEFDADARSLNSGTVLAIGPYRIERVSTDEHYETTGGQKVRVLPGADGRYPASAFGETWARLLLAINFELPLTVTAEYEASVAEVEDKYVDLNMTRSAKFIFPAANANDLTFINCKGRIRDYRADHAGDLGGGSFTGLYLYQCEELQVHGYEISGSKDTPIRIFDCDYVWAAWGRVTGGATRNNAGIVACSRYSGFYFCQGHKVGFGFIILGAGYLDGGYTPPRASIDEHGMFVRDSYIYDHTAHAFDINGASGASLSRNISDNYTGVGGHGAHQIKNSTNLPGETAEGTRMSVVEYSIAIDASVSFGAQSTKGAVFRGLHSVGAHNYAMYLNDCDDAVIDGVDIEDWGQKPYAASTMVAGDKYIVAAAGSTDFTALGAASNTSGTFFTATGAGAGTGTVFKSVNGEDKIAAIGVSATSENVTVGGVAIKQNNVLYPLAMRQVYLGGPVSRMESLKVSRLLGQSPVAEGLKIVGQNCTVSDRVIPRHATALLIDDAQTTQYSMRYAKTITVSAGGTHTFDDFPARGMTVGSVSCYVAGGTVTDHTFTLGRVGSNSSVQSTRAVATGSAKPTATQLDPGIPIQAFANTTGGTVTMNIAVSGVPLI